MRHTLLTVVFASRGKALLVVTAAVHRVQAVKAAGQQIAQLQDAGAELRAAKRQIQQVKPLLFA